MQSSFPLLSGNMGRSITIPGADQTQAGSGGNEEAIERLRAVGYPGVYYCHNVMPTSQGYSSLSYTNKIAAAASTAFDAVHLLRDASENRIWFAGVPSYNWFLGGTNAAWASKASSAPATGLVTKAYIRKRTFVFFEGYGCYEYTASTDTFAAVTLTGLTVANINGICAAKNYLIAWDDNYIYWSMPNTETNFSGTGSGSGALSEARGLITTCLPIPDGFIAYTTANAVAGIFTGNGTYPFLYKEIEGSAGVLSPEHVAYESNVAGHFAWTTGGLMEINKTTAHVIFPEVSDFLSGKHLETYSAGTLSTVKLDNALRIKLTLIGSRYLVISYGNGGLQFALIYDIKYKRWGKLAKTHVDVIEYTDPSPYSYVQYQQLVGTYTAQTSTYAGFSSSAVTVGVPNGAIGFIENSGKIDTVNLDDTGVSGNDSVLLFGKIQFVRNRQFSFLGMELENQKLTAAGVGTVAVDVLTSYTGKKQHDLTTTLSPVSGTENDESVSYATRLTGEWHSLRITGGFNLNTITVLGHAAGRR